MFLVQCYSDPQKTAGTWSRGESGSSVSGSEFAAKPHPPPASKSLTRIKKKIYIENNLSPREFAFVEAVLVHVIHKMGSGEFARDGVIRMTNRQIQEIAEDRHPEIFWSSDEQVERLKCKYIDRPADGKPAERLELLREVRKGRPRSRQQAGTPSEYQPTGIGSLLDRAGVGASGFSPVA